MAEIEEPFLPLPDDLIVNLAESRPVIEALLDALPTMFAANMTVRALWAAPVLALFLQSMYCRLRSHPCSPPTSL